LIGYNKDDVEYLNGSFCQLYSFANESASPLKKSLNSPWCHFILV
jgi:hypothetical protein